MILILLTALVLFAGAITLVLRLLGLRYADTQQKISRIASYGFAKPRADAAERPTLQAWLDSLATSIGGFFDRHLMDDSRERELRKLLYAAGLYRTTPRRFLGYRLLLTLALEGVWVWLAVASGKSVAVGIFGAGCIAALGWIAPAFFVKRRATERLERVDHEIPELVDLLVTAIEGGLGFAGSLQLVAQNLEGPLGEEVRIAIQEQAMGLTTSEALTNMGNRIETLSMRSFIQAVNQGELLGVSIGKIMRDLAHEMRSRRRQAAEERAHKTGTKIIFPVAFCIFPAIFVIALGPPLLYISHGLGGV